MKQLLKKISLILLSGIVLFSCDRFLKEDPRDKLPEEEVYKTLSDLYLNTVASLYNYVGGFSDSQGLQGTGRGVYDLMQFRQLGNIFIRW